MPTIKVELRVTNDEMELLRMGKCDQPNPERLKQMLLAAAWSNVRTIRERINGARQAEFKIKARVHKRERAAREVQS